MAAAMAYCTNRAFYQHSLAKARTQFTPISRRTTLSPSASCSTVSIPQIEQLSIIKTIKSDENNNSHQIETADMANIDDILDITSDDDIDDNQLVNDIDEEQFLAFVGLRRKIRKPIVRNLYLRSLTKRLACPVCLLPLPKYSERVRQALYVRLPFLKFLSITCDIESFCSTDENAKAQSLLPRSVTQTRASSTLNRIKKKQKLPKTDLINMTPKISRNNTNKTSMSKYVNSVFKCHVVLDRLEQSTIDQMIQNSTEDNDKNIAPISTTDRSLRKTCKARRSLSIATNKTTTTTTTLTTITTMTTEKTTVKRKSTAAEIIKPKRIKSMNNNCATINDDGNIKNDSSSSIYQRIYLKCFVCSKREYVDAQVTNSDVLHSHWLEHDKDLLLNIYDSEIDSILTRVVEFFNLPKQHMLEGKIKTVFMLNSKEIRLTPTTNLSSNDSYIVID
ncbi:unnamed protein product [Rotaria sordida]|uniref:Uncharacterized protein n=1 Tax=Rotaria sordida TaxID=392033 RepID=A0A818XJI9_9BILA|nr:unnamed protein product [Rotaria sordida]